MLQEHFWTTTTFITFYHRPSNAHRQSIMNRVFSKRKVDEHRLICPMTSLRYKQITVVHLKSRKMNQLCQLRLSAALQPLIQFVLLISWTAHLLLNYATHTRSNTRQRNVNLDSHLYSYQSYICSCFSLVRPATTNEFL